MSTSLKAFASTLVPILGVSSDALYERQRALVREGLLKSSEGRGPGSGVRATPESVASLLIALMSSVDLTNAGLRAHAMARATPGGGVCKITGASNFKDAVAAILVNPKLSAKIERIRVSASAGMAQIELKRGDPSTFIGPLVQSPPLITDVTIKAETIQSLTEVVSSLAEMDDGK